jgi:hypothetical protein
MDMRVREVVLSQWKKLNCILFTKSLDRKQYCEQSVMDDLIGEASDIIGMI